MIFQLCAFGNVAKENKREFTIDLWSDDEDYLDFGTDDEIDHNTSLTDLLDRDDRRREETQVREREERESRRTQTLENTANNAGDLIFSLFSFKLFSLLIYFLSIVVASPELPISKIKCCTLNCTTVFEATIRTEYVEFEVVDGKKKCYNCYQNGLQIARKLWEEEQRRDIGPDWIGCPTRKKMPFKRPITLSSDSTSLSAGGGGARPVANSEKVLSVSATGVI